MKAVIIDGPGQVTIGDVEATEPQPGEVVIDIDLVGVCATDVHILHGTLPTARYPVIPGHEATGVVAACGPGVTSVDVGDRVVIDPGVPCGVCSLCRRGRLNLCEQRDAIGISLPGATRESLKVPASNCHRVVTGTTSTAAVLAEPLACVVHAFDLIAPIEATDVLVYGGGTIGILSAAVARVLGAPNVCVVEIDKERRRNVEAAGFAAVGGSAEAAPEEWDVVIDATGAPAAIADGLARLRRGGTLLQIGVARPDATIPLSPYQVFSRELRIVGSMTTRNSFPRALQLLASGAIPVDSIVGSPFALADYEAAIEQAGSGRVPKVTIAPRV